MFTKQKLKAFLYKQKHILALLLIFPPALWFALLERVNQSPTYYMYSLLDKYIPFSEIFVIPYCFWYVYVIGTLVFLFFKSPEGFVRLNVTLWGGMMIACFIYTVFPNGQELRSKVIADNWMGDIIRHLYSVDTPTNSAPSIHVMHSVAVHAAISHYKGFTGARHMVRIASFIAMVLICLSTVMIKQHSVVDVFTGLIASAFIYLFAYRSDLLTGVKTAGANASAK